MATRTVHLHVGLPKAASTSLQNALLLAREALAGRGIAYPSTDPGQRFKRQRALTDALRGDGAARKTVIAGLGDAAQAGHHTLILSGEMIHLAEPAAAAAILQEGGWGDAALSTFAIVRDPATWINSQYAFSAVHFMQREEFHPFASRLALRDRCNWHRLLGLWIAQTDFAALPLSAVGDSRSVVDRAFEHMGLGAPPEANSENERVDPRTIEAALRIAERRFQDGRLGRMGPITNALKSQAKRRGWTQKFCGLDAALAREIADHTAPAREAFAQAVWGRPWQDVYADPAPDRFVSNEWRASAEAAPDEIEPDEIEDVVRLIEERLDAGDLQVA